MDREPEDLHSLNLAGILKESFRILGAYAKLFASLTSTLILPLCFMLLAHHLVSGPLIHKIHHNEDVVAEHEGTPAADKSEKELASEWIKLLLFFAGYLVFVLAFSLLSTAAVVYSVASIYTEKELSYVKVLSVVPRVWKRLLITFFWVFLLMSAYHLAAVVSIRIMVRVFIHVNDTVFVILLLLALAFFGAMQIYLSCIWHLASVISVLEESFGLGALRRSVSLITGKKFQAFGLFSIYLSCGGIIWFLFYIKVVRGHHHHVALLSRVIFGTVLILLLSFVTLCGILVQTVFYFACKSFHRERIDWSALSEHLGTYLGEYVPLKSSIQMETMEV